MRGLIEAELQTVAFKALTIDIVLEKFSKIWVNSKMVVPIRDIETEKGGGLTGKCIPQFANVIVSYR